jgi:hypothetical protein
MGFEATVSQERELRDAEFSTIVHDGNGMSVIRTLAYPILASLNDYRLPRCYPPYNHVGDLPRPSNTVSRHSEVCRFPSLK